MPKIVIDIKSYIIFCGRCHLKNGSYCTAFQKYLSRDVRLPECANAQISEA